MSRRVNRHHQPSQWTNRKSNASGHSASPCIQPMNLAPALNPFGHTENIRSGNPISTRCGCIANDEMSIYSFIVKYKTMECNSCMNFIEYNDATMERSGLQWTNPDGFSSADGGVHAGAAGLKSHRRPLMQELYNDVLISRHERTIPYLKGVGKT